MSHMLLICDLVLQKPQLRNLLHPLKATAQSVHSNVWHCVVLGPQIPMSRAVLCVPRAMGAIACALSHAS